VYTICRKNISHKIFLVFDYRRIVSKRILQRTYFCVDSGFVSLRTNCCSIGHDPVQKVRSVAVEADQWPAAVALNEERHALVMEPSPRN